MKQAGEPAATAERAGGPAAGGLRQLYLRDFRCIPEARLELSGQDTYIFGPNGAGKTSALEAAYFLGRGRSFRTHRAGKLVRDGARHFEVVGRVSRAGHDIVLGVRGSQKGTEARVGGVAAPSLAALAEQLPVQVIDTEVHKLVEEGPSHRRRFLDWGVFHVKPRFMEAWRRHRRALRQRNAALRAGAPDRDVRSWDAEFVAASHQITALRREYTEQIQPLISRMAEELLGAAASLAYLPGWAADQALEDALAAGLARDRDQGRTRAGPHRADLTIRLGDRVARDRVSRGQQKLLAATLVLAQLELLREEAGTGGLLLLDDPAAELDAAALDGLFAQITRLGVQRIVTGLTDRGLQPGTAARRYRISRGEVTELV